MPAFRSPFKSVAEDPGPTHRLQMCRLATAEIASMDVSALELQRGGDSYTVDTLKALHAAHPGTELTFIVGADVAAHISSWREPRELLALARFAVALRAGAEPREPEKIRAALDPLVSANNAPFRGLRFLDMPVLDISSSLVRERVRSQLAIEELVGPAVATYIATHGLYRAASTAADAA
jgi:nicotinate-nucleotide adenylyltransferase